MKKNIGAWNRTSLNKRFRKSEYENKSIFNKILRFIFICAAIFLFWWIAWKEILDINRRDIIVECQSLKKNLEIRQNLFNPSDEAKKTCAKYGVSLERRKHDVPLKRERNIVHQVYHWKEIGKEVIKNG